MDLETRPVNGDSSRSTPNYLADVSELQKYIVLRINFPQKDSFIKDLSAFVVADGADDVCMRKRLGAGRLQNLHSNSYLAYF